MEKKIKLWLIGSLPMFAVALLALLYIVPKHVAGLSAVMPMVPLIPVFIWGVMHPRDISFLGLAVIGLAVDVATGLPLGFSPLAMIGFFLLVRSQRKYIYREGFAVMWGYFALLFLALQCMGWAGYAYVHGQAAPIGSALLQWVFTVLIYPLLHYLLYPLVEKIGHARYRLLHA